MPTITRKQKKLVRLAIVDDSSTKKELLRNAGYSEATCIKPSQVFGSEGVQSLLAKAQGVEGLDDISILQGISKAIKQQFKGNKADYALKWLQLIYTSKANISDNRKVTINQTPDMSKVDTQAHQYIANKYNLTVPEMIKRLKKKA